MLIFAQLFYSLNGLSTLTQHLLIKPYFVRLNIKIKSNYLDLAWLIELLTVYIYFF